MALLEDTIRRRAQVVSREMIDGAVLVDMLDDRCFELNRVGGLFWSSLATPRTIDQICETLLPGLGAPREVLAADLCRLVDDLLRAGLIELLPIAKPAGP
ncbi:MAG: hypothetical protein JWM82_4131 [Myxococcales bacterium]|nr:hypothetical protein [Myxococcales bacterium]